MFKQLFHKTKQFSQFRSYTRVFKRYLTFNDVALVPQFNNVPSRLIPTLETNLTTKTKIEIPIVASNMDTVICDELADLLIKNGSIPIFHRFTSFEQQKTWAKKYGDKCYISCGLGNIDKTLELLELGPRGICIDIAHGHSDTMIEFIKEIKRQMPKAEVIAGNVCTGMGYQDLVHAGADAVKVGVGPGAACTTRIKTGFGVPQFSAILDCAQVAKRLKVPIIADGGIVYERDMCLALAAGANAVMMGSKFAKTLESAAKKIKTVNPETGEEEIRCVYRGQASKEFQQDYYGGVKSGTVAEGVQFDAVCTGSAQQIIDDFCGALRSSLTYGGAKSIAEFQRKAEFVEVTRNYLTESFPRPY